MDNTENKLKDYDYDLICIGCGSAGLACVKEAASLGAKCLSLDFVKPSPRNTTWGIGGTCVNCGCIPKKLMHQAAILGSSIYAGVAYSWNIPNLHDIRLNWSELVLQIHHCIKATNWTIKVQLRLLNITYWNGLGSFIDEHTVHVKMLNGEERTATGKYIVIAVGGRPVYPNIPGALDYGITSDDLFFLPKPPGRTLIIGAGYIGIETANFLNDFGFDVTLMSRDIILRRFDREMIEHIKENLETQGVRFLIGYQVKSIEKNTHKRLLVKYSTVNPTVSNNPNSERNNSIISDHEQEVFDTVLFATTRRVQLEDLNINAVNLKIKDDEFMVDIDDRTNKAHIFALGDAAYGRPKLTPVAILSGRLLARRVFGQSTTLMNYQNVPTALFTSLEYSFVGLSEEAAQAKYGEDQVEVFHGYFMPEDYYIMKRVKKCCYLKVITKREGEQVVLGIHFLGPAASEIMTGFAVAMNCGLSANQLFNTIGVHVTGSSKITELQITKRSGCDPFPPYYNDMFV